MGKRYDDLDAKQKAVLDRAAFVLIQARDEADAILREVGIELPDNPFASPCQGTFDQDDLFTSPPHGDSDCACARYKGDGIRPCINTFVNPYGANFGAGVPRRKCGHLPGAHFRMD